MLFVFLALMEFALVNVLSRKKPKVTEDEDVEMVRMRTRKSWGKRRRHRRGSKRKS